MNLSDHIHPQTQCDLCGIDARRVYVAASGVQNVVGQPVTLSTVLCRNCGFAFQRERFSDELLVALYESDTSFAFEDDPAVQSLVEAHLQERRQVISRAMAANGLTRGCTVLDVGGGVGERSRHLLDDHTVLLVDANEREPVDSRIRKIPGLFDSQLQDDSCDVVILNHSWNMYSPHRCH